jgi:hypothetical protein
MSEFVTRRNFSATPKNYFKIGKITDEATKRTNVSFVGKLDNVECAFNIMQGYLVDLVPTDREWNGEIIKSLNIYLSSPDGAVIDVISTSRYSGFVRDMLLRLLNVTQISYIALTPFVWSPKSMPDKQFVGCSVRHNDKYLPELYESMKLVNNNKEYLPKVEIEKLKSGKEVQDTTQRDKAIDDLILLIKSRLLWNASALRQAYINTQSNYLPADSSQYEEVVEEEFDDAVPF